MLRDFVFGSKATFARHFANKQTNKQQIESKNYKQTNKQQTNKQTKGGANKRMCGNGCGCGCGYMYVRMPSPLWASS